MIALTTGQLTAIAGNNGYKLASEAIYIRQPERKWARQAYSHHPTDITTTS